MNRRSTSERRLRMYSARVPTGTSTTYAGFTNICSTIPTNGISPMTASRTLTHGFSSWIRPIARGVQDVVRRSPQRPHAALLDRADRHAAGIGDVVSRADVDDAVGAHPIDLLGLARITEDSHVFAEPEGFLLYETDRRARRVGAFDRLPERENAEPERERIGAHGRANGITIRGSTSRDCGGTRCDPLGSYSFP